MENSHFHMLNGTIMVPLEIGTVMTSEHIINNDTIDEFYTNAQEHCMDTKIDNVYDNIMHIYMNTVIKYQNFSTEELIKKFVHIVIYTGTVNGYCICTITKHLLMIFIVELYELNPNLIKRIVKEQILEYGKNSEQTHTQLSTVVNRMTSMIQQLLGQFSAIKPDTITEEEFSTLHTTNLHKLKEILTKEKHNTDDLICNICQDNYENADKITILQCSSLHNYHEDCIKKWVTNSHSKCPVCKSPVIKKENGSSTVSNDKDTINSLKK